MIVRDSAQPTGEGERHVATTDETAPAYKCEDIRVLPATEHIRLRPGMYIGDTGIRGLHHLVDEVVSNAVAEAEAGSCNRISVELLSDRGCRIKDNGRGIPVDIVPQLGKRILELVLTEAGTLGKPAQAPYRVKTGFFSIGLQAVNALSDRLIVEVWRDGRRWQQEFSRGHPCSEPIPIEETNHTGTAIAFWSDPEIFTGACYFEYQLLAARLRDLAALNHGLTIELIDRRWEPTQSEVFCYWDGLRDYLRDLNRTRQPIHPHIFAFRQRGEEHEVEVALQWTTSEREDIRGYANCCFSRLGGTHVTGFLRALTVTLGEDLPPNDEGAELIGADFRKGLTALVAIKITEPQWESASFARLNNPEAEGLVLQTVSEHLGQFLREHPEDTRAIRQHAEAARQARRAVPRRRRRDPPRPDPKTGMS